MTSSREDDTVTSGLRDPRRAVRGLGAGTLVLEGITLLLAIQPIRMLGGGLTGAAVAAIVGAATAAFLLAGMMRRNWAWYAGSALQAALIAGVLLHWTVGAVGVIFGLVWLYILKVRRTILG